MGSRHGEGEGWPGKRRLLPYCDTDSDPGTLQTEFGERADGFTKVLIEFGEAKAA